MTKTGGCLINLCLIYALLVCLIVLKLVLHHFSYQSYKTCHVTLSFLLRLVSKSPKKSDPPHAARRTEYHIFHVKYNIINELKLIYIYTIIPKRIATGILPSSLQRYDRTKMDRRSKFLCFASSTSNGLYIRASSHRTTLC